MYLSRGGVRCVIHEMKRYHIFLFLILSLIIVLSACEKDQNVFHESPLFCFHLFRFLFDSKHFSFVSKHRLHLNNNLSVCQFGKLTFFDFDSIMVLSENETNKTVFLFPPLLYDTNDHV